MIHSYDFFDTLFTRGCLVPKDVFYYLGIEANLNGIIHTDPKRFMQMRADSEITARRNSPYEEVTLAEIYEVMNGQMQLDKDQVATLMNMEIETELLFIKPIHENLQKLDENSVIISDFYMPSDFFIRALKQTNTPYKKIIVSCEHRKTKHSGKLFVEALTQFPIASHTGDNLHSDVKMPIKQSISSQYFEKAHPNKTENELSSENYIPFELSTLIAGCMRSTRNSVCYENTSLQALHDTTSNYVAPFLYGYVYSVLQKALDRGLTDLYFIARDGQILHEIAKTICADFGYRLNLHYLYGSRKAWHLPSVHKVDERVLDWIFDPTTHLSIADVCKRVELSTEEVMKHLGTFVVATDKNLTSTERKELKEIFRHSEPLKQLIQTKAENLRKLVTEYLKQEGFERNKKIGVVDVGWRGRQQVSLSILLESGGLYPETGISGFYIALPHAVTPFKKDLFDTFIDHTCYPELMQRLFMYELFVTANHESCVGYEQKNGIIVPDLRKGNKQTLSIEQIEVQHNGIQVFSKYISPLLSKYLSKERLDKPSLILIDKLLRFPDEKASKAYSSVVMYEDQEESIAYSICRKISPVQLLKYMTGLKHSIDYNTWLEGSVRAYYPKVIATVILRALAYRFTIATKLKR